MVGRKKEGERIPERDYRLGSITGDPIEPPVLLSETSMGEPCPHCGADALFPVRVKMEMGVGTYIGCAACPYASPMILMLM